MNFLNSVISTNTDILEESITIDNFYNKSLLSLSSVIKNLHSDFILDQKKIFKSFDSTASAARSAIRILDAKYKYYSNDIFGWVNKNSDKFTKVLLIHNKNVYYQAKIIEEKMKTNHTLERSVFRIPKDIYFETKAQIKQEINMLGELLYGSSDEDEIANLWFMSKETLIARMEKEKVVYLEEGNKSAKEIIEKFKSYQEDVKVYWKKYKENIEALKKSIEKNKKLCEKYIEEKIPAMGNKTEEEKQELIRRYRENVDSSVELMKMITEHYKYQLKMIIQSLKVFSLVIQDVYDYVLENK